MRYYPFTFFPGFWLGEREATWCRTKCSRCHHAAGRAAKPGVQGRSPGRRV